MTELTHPFTPDWVSPPSDTIADLLEERDWTQAQLADRLGYTKKHVSHLINGKAPIEPIWDLFREPPMLQRSRSIRIKAKQQQVV
ncbi:MAG: helix-turn-helix transcriptional regulator [Elainellaceae cyanobacterium]